MPSQIKILYGDLFTSDADALLLPMDDDRFTLGEIQRKLQEYWRVDLPITGSIPPGDFITSPIRGSIRKNNGNPVNFLLFTNFGNNPNRRLSNLIEFLPTLAKFSRENPNLREIAIPMDRSWAERDVLGFLADQIYMHFFPAAYQDCNIELIFETLQDSEGMNEVFLQYLALRKRKVRLRQEYEQEGSREKLLSKKYYLLRGFAERGKEWINPSASLLRDHDDDPVMETFRLAPKGSLIFLSSSVSSDMDFFPISAIGEVIENLNGNFQVIWFSEGFTGHLKNLGYPLRSINEIEIPDEKRKLYELLKASFFSEFISPSPQERERLPKNVDLANDYEIGEDYLEIAEDVDAFSRIIALRDLRPPLAIALCGQWGSGKSFFMGKMIDKISSLAASENGPFCKGITHIQFNAWSYMDSNLWVGLVTKIFNGINAYVNEHIESKALKNRIKNDLQAQVSLSQESVFNLEKEKQDKAQHLKDIQKERANLALSLKFELKELERKSYTDFIKKAFTELAVEKKIDEALQQNESVQSVSAYIQKHYPEELYADGKWLKKEVSRWKTFLLDFFSWQRIKGNLWWILAIVLVIWLLPKGLNYTLTLIKNLKFTLSKESLAYIAIGGTLVKKSLQSYKKIEPLFSALWEVKKQYLDKMEEAKHQWQQKESALQAQIALDQERIGQLDIEITQAKADLIKVEFRLVNRLNTETFQKFIGDKSGDAGYRKHQGIVATIRDDFETLSNLFEAYAEEWRADPEQDPKKRPLERIVLYIDDLDRCDEARVLEVLEAVHLIMAFNLFVVVVGLDPARVKSALANQLRGKGKKLDPNTASKYLEKIFQVPFQLNPPSDRSVKNMLDKLLQSKEKRASAPIIPAHEQFDTFPIELDTVHAENVQDDAITDQNAIPKTTSIEKLLIGAESIKRIGDFSDLIGSNPRSVKRFVNILRIIRAHDMPIDSSPASENIKDDVISFLLALSIGPYHELYQELTVFLNDKPLGTMNDLTTSLPTKTLQKEKEILHSFLNLDQQRALLQTPLELIGGYNMLVRRFSFEDFG